MTDLFGQVLETARAAGQRVRFTVTGGDTFISNREKQIIGETSGAGALPLGETSDANASALREQIRFGSLRCDKKIYLRWVMTRVNT